MRVPEVLRGPADPLGDDLGRFDGVAVDVDGAEAHVPPVAVLREELEDRIAVVPRGVAVRELPRPLSAPLRLEERRKEVRVVRVADVHRELGVQALRRGVEPVDHDRRLVRVGARGRLVDLDHAAPAVDERAQRGPDRPTGEVDHELLLRGPPRRPALPAGLAGEVVPLYDQSARV